MDLCTASFLPQGSQSTPCQRAGAREETYLQTRREVVTSQTGKKVTSKKHGSHENHFSPPGGKEEISNLNAI